MKLASGVSVFFVSIAVAIAADRGIARSSRFQVPRELWRVGESGQGVPAFDGTAVYGLTARGQLLAIDAVKGTVRWKITTSPGRRATVGSTVLVSAGIVVAGDYDLIARDAETGRPRWRFVPASGFGVGAYLGSHASGLVFAGSASGQLFAVDLLTGKEKWRRAISSIPKTTVFAPMSVGELVIAGYTEFTAPAKGGVFAVDKAKGEVVWKHEFGTASTANGSISGPVALGSSRIAVSSSDGRIHVLRTQDGKADWVIPSPAGDRRKQEYRGLASFAEVLFAGSSDGEIVAYDTSSRTTKWRSSPSTLGSTTFRLAASADAVYVPSFSGTLVVLKAGDGTELWRIGPDEAKFVMPPAIVGGRIVLASNAGYHSFDTRIR